MDDMCGEAPIESSKEDPEGVFFFFSLSLSLSPPGNKEKGSTGYQLCSDISSAIHGFANPILDHEK